MRQRHRKNVSGSLILKYLSNRLNSAAAPRKKQKAVSVESDQGEGSGDVPTEPMVQELVKEGKLFINLKRHNG